MDAVHLPESVAVVVDRLATLAAVVAISGSEVVVVGSGADLQYLAGRSVASHERLTALAVPADSPPVLLVPALERAGWDGSPVEVAGVRIETWLDGQDPHALLAQLLPAGTRAVAVDDHLPAVHALRLRDALPGCDLTLAGPVLSDLRLHKSPTEVAALTAVGEAIDRVHARIGEWLRAGRTENEVAADIAAAMVAEGHERPDFVIVASGPNGASPHHEASDRVIQAGDPVVVDIGGPAPSGYFSDCTRTYQVAGEPPEGFREVYEIVLAAQRAGVAAAVAGVPAQDVDAAARAVITEAGFGERFITRTGHGIGLEVHEQPYLVDGNSRPLADGMAFSVEPGVYLAGRFGVRIEDIVVVSGGAPVLINRCPKELVVVG